MKINIEVEEQYLRDLIDKIFDAPRFDNLNRKDLIKEEIFEKIKTFRNDGVIIRAGYGGFNSNSYFANQIKSAFAGIYKRDRDLLKNS
jgi:phosphoribosylpyrophosphate synthetase